MPDDISIPRSMSSGGAAPVSQAYTHSYRARRSGMDTGTRRLLIVAGALGFALLGGMGVWTLRGHRGAEVPVIEADTRPLRVKPEDPGGMTVVGANEQVMGGRGDKAGAGDLAPEAERPDPQALRAQRQAAAPSPMPAAPATPAPVARTAAPEAAKPPATGGAATTGAATNGAATNGAATNGTAIAGAATGGVVVQVAAVDSEAAALPEWQRLARKAPELLGDRKPSVVRAERDGKTVWRLRVNGFADTAAATEFCRKLRGKGLGCTLSS